MFIGELEEQQNKKRRIGEETRGQAEDGIAMQLATDESLAAEMEEEGEDDKGAIDVAGLIGWKINDLVVRDEDEESEFWDSLKLDGFPLSE